MSKLILEKNTLIPKNWIDCKLGDIANVNDVNHKMPRSVDDGVPFVSSKDFTDDGIDFTNVKYISTKDFETLSRKVKPEYGDILYSRIGTIGKARLSPNKEFGISYSLAVIRPYSKSIFNKFVLYLVQSPSIYNQSQHNKHSIGVPDLGLTEIRNFSLLLPPINEQKRIVTKIEELFSLVDSTKKLLENTRMLLKQYRQTLLKSAFEGKLVPQDPNDEPAETLLEKIKQERVSKNKNDVYSSELVLDRTIMKLPEGWALTKIRDVVINPKNDIVDGPFGSNLKSSEYTDHGVPIIRLQNVDRNRFINKNTKYITKEKSERLKRHSFLYDDIVITKLGIPVGKACLVPEYLKNGIIVADILRMRVLEEFISRKFLMYLINSDIVVKQFASHTKGTTRPRVNLTKFRDFIIPISPLNEQKRIVTKIEEGFSLIENDELIISNSLKNIEALRNSVLQQAFEGKLVPQDPNDEPAETLLEKIKQEKQKIISQTAKLRKINDK